MLIYLSIYLSIGKTGNKSDCRRMYGDEKTQSLHRMILFIELFVNVKRFGF